MGSQVTGGLGDPTVPTASSHRSTCRSKCRRLQSSAFGQFVPWKKNADVADVGWEGMERYESWEA